MRNEARSRLLHHARGRPYDRAGRVSGCRRCRYRRFSSSLVTRLGCWARWCLTGLRRLFLEWVADLHDRQQDAEHRAGEYRLRIVGHVERPVTLTLGDLRSLPRAEQVSDFHCVTGWSVYGVHWGGVRLADVIEQAKPLEGWRSLRFVSDEVPYDDSLTHEQALLGDVMLALDMDGKPLSRPHGAPARVVMHDVRGQERQLRDPHEGRTDVLATGTVRRRRRRLARRLDSAGDLPLRPLRADAVDLPGQSDS